MSAKLHAYGLDIESLNIVQDYLSNRKQRTKVDSFYSSWEAILSRVPRGSTLGPLLFNIFMCDMFLKLKPTYLLVMQMIAQHLWLEITLVDVIKSLEEIGEKLVKRFSNNEMKLSTDNFHLFYIPKNLIRLK